MRLVLLPPFALTMAATVLLSLMSTLAAVPLGAAMDFDMIPQTSPDNPIKSYAANAVIRGSPSGTLWWSLFRALNASGCVEDREAGLKWFHDADFWFVSANTYGESSAKIGPYYYCVQAWSDLPEQGGVLLATSNSVTVHFDFTRQSLTATLSAASISPGVLQLTASYAVASDWKGNPVPVETIASWWNETKLFSWVKCYAKVNSSGGYVLDSLGNQAFDFDSSGYTHSPVPVITSSFSRAGIKYFAIQNLWNGEYGWSWPRQGLVSHPAAFVCRSPMCSRRCFLFAGIVFYFAAAHDRALASCRFSAPGGRYSLRKRHNRRVALGVPRPNLHCRRHSGRLTLAAAPRRALRLQRQHHALSPDGRVRHLSRLQRPSVALPIVPRAELAHRVGPYVQQQNSRLLQL
jgi:hypothetical protein